VTATHAVTSNDIRVIVCIAFDRRIAPLEIAAFKANVLKCPSVLHAVEVSGTFDFIIEATIPDMQSYATQLSLCGETVARLVSRYEANFVCKRFVTEDERKHALWIPCDDGVVRIDCTKIDKVTAEGDYMRVHSAGQSWLIHSTMSAIVDCVGAEGFFRLHRSILVRRDFIQRLTHDQSHWTATLNDGTRERVAKVHIGALLQTLRASPTKHAASSSKVERSGELSLID
jgi:DNA-binding LytR/AlgR family response regulator